MIIYPHPPVIALYGRVHSFPLIWGAATWCVLARQREPAWFKATYSLEAFRAFKFPPTLLLFPSLQEYIAQQGLLVHLANGQKTHAT